MNVIKAGASLMLLLSANLSVAENHHHSTKQFKVTELKPGFHFLQGKGGNILLSEGDDGLSIVTMPICQVV